MWRTQTELLADGRTRQTRILSDGEPLLYSEVLRLWRADDGFADFFSSELARAPFEAYFWETPRIDRGAVERAFEFVLIESPTLARVEPDQRAFAEHFGGAAGGAVATFPNLGHDAVLVAPCPEDGAPGYAHLASFLRSAPEPRRRALWRAVGSAIERELSDRPLWVSTAGLGIYWLHVRLDSFPKYYSHSPYKSGR
jgi:hypothetical protein